MQGYDGGSSDSECESATMDEQESRSPLMPEFWLIVKIHQDRVKVFSHSRSGIPQKILLLKHVGIHGNSTGLPQTLRPNIRIVLTISPFCDIVQSEGKRFNVC